MMVEERKKSHSTNLLYLGAKMMGPLLLLGGEWVMSSTTGASENGLIE